MISSGRDTDADPLQPFRPVRGSCIVSAIAIIIRGVDRCATCTTMDTGGCVLFCESRVQGKTGTAKKSRNERRIRERRGNLEIIIIVTTMKARLANFTYLLLIVFTLLFLSVSTGAEADKLCAKNLQNLTFTRYK